MCLIDEIMIHFDANNFPFRLELETGMIRNPEKILYLQEDGRTICIHYSVMSIIDDWLNGDYKIHMYRVKAFSSITRKYQAYDTL